VSQAEALPSGTPAVRTLTQIHEPAVRAMLEELLARPDTLGALLCGSRVLGWADPDGDYDPVVVVTPERFRSLTPEETLVRIYAEGESPRRMIGDFSIFSEETFEEALRSPLDIDHWLYVDAVVLADRTGGLEDWRRQLAAFPESSLRERAVNRYLTLLIAGHSAVLDDVRGFDVDRQMNLHRAGLAGIHLWFTLQRRWAPPLKWWTREVERLSIRPDTRAVLEAVVLNPTIDTATHLREHMKSEMRHAGIGEVDDITAAFARSLLPERRAAVYRDSFL
jgi:predicted nucleotidyltransferase